MPDETAGDNEKSTITVDLRLGDCLEVMKTLPAGSVDAVVTDPPYGVDLKSYRSFDDSKEAWVNVVPATIKWADERNLPCILFAAAPTQSRDLAAFHRPPDRTLIWNPSFSLAKARANGIFFRWHPIYCWNLPKKHDGPSIDVIRDPCDGHNWWYHPGTKPLALILRLVQFARAGATVLDPFMGSGTTGVACVQMGRNFIGIEIDPGYFEIAKKRVEEAQLQTRMAL